MEDSRKKVVLVTGASSGIGLATALALLDRGHIVYGAARRLPSLETNLLPKGGHAIQMDITSENDVISAVKRLMKEQGRIDVLVNNAGCGTFGAIEDVTMEDARQQFEVNLFGLALLTKQVLPHMREQKSGNILNVSSISGVLPSPFFGWYTASKHALNGWSDSLRMEVEQFNIYVSIFTVGVTDTEIREKMEAQGLRRKAGSIYAANMDKLQENGGTLPMCHPSVIAKVIVQAAESKRPKRRYTVGPMARPLLAFHACCGGDALEALMKKSMS